MLGVIQKSLYEKKVCVGKLNMPICCGPNISMGYNRFLMQEKTTTLSTMDKWRENAERLSDLY